MSEKVNVIIPTIGESISEGTIGRWFFKEGDLVKKDQPLFELDSDKATLEVPSAATGVLRILIPAGKSASVGTLVGVIEASDSPEKYEPLAASTKPTSFVSAPMPAPKVEAPKPTPPAPSATTAAKPAQVSSEDLKGVSPSKRRMIREGVLPPPGSSTSFWDEKSENVLKTPMTTIRKRIAERLLESQQTTATLTTFNEVDMSAVMSVRSQLKDQFEQKHGVKLGFMSFFSKAVIEALTTFPDVNARIEGGDILYPQYVNLGIAISTDRGLVVPVIRGAQNLSYADIEKRIADFAERARAQKLQIPEMSGGTFTLTNGGVFGSLLSTPILNPPQSGILGMHKIEQRPMAIAQADKTFKVEVRPMMYVALSYDHRLIDGATSVGFLVKVKEYLEKITVEIVSR
jgi:2-oxoglutarate dehydrogenase E2 component (dihydrolipoamide succinyltransferase)